MLRIKEIPFLGTCKNFLGGMPPDPPRRDHLRRSIITIRLLRNFCQLLEKLWTTLEFTTVSTVGTTLGLKELICAVQSGCVNSNQELVFL